VIDMELPDCGDSSCVFAEKKTGQRTNGGCRCFDDAAYGPKAQKELLRLARHLAITLRGAARVQEVLRTSNEHLLKSRDEARRVARELALTSRYAEGAWLDAEHAIDALGRYQVAEHIALAYPDTTKETTE
jgi:hypothetical protein